MADLSQLTPKELIERIPQVVKPESLEGIEGVLQFNLSGDQGGNWYLTVKDKKMELTDGIAENPRITLSASAKDFKNIVTGKTNAMQAFMLGKIKISGDMNLAMKLQSLFRS
jgi:putative sterol carrier protein